MTELERYKEAMEVALDVLDVCTRHMENERYTASTLADLARINAILNHQEFEEVEVVSYQQFDEKGTNMGWRDLPASDLPNGWQEVKLTGTIRRPVPQKVERSVSVEASIHDDHGGAVADTRSNGAFYHYPECHGKRGTLTFTWTE